MPQKFKFLVLLVVLSMLLTFAVINQEVFSKSTYGPTLQATASSIRSTSKEQRDCLILLWAHVKGQFEVPTHPLCGGGCEITFDRKRIEEASAVVFMMKSLTLKDLPEPSSRSEDQVYVWFSRESPWTSKNFYGKPLEKFAGYFNWTMSFRFDSDVDASMILFTSRPFVSYFYNQRLINNLPVTNTQKILPELRQHMLNISAQYCTSLSEKTKPIPDVSNKTGLVIWKAKDCHVTKGAKTRTAIVKKLKLIGLQIDGDSPCLGKSKTSKKFIPMSELFDIISSHKFYLSLENSYHCRDYITEKLWYNAFYLGVVPVVWGGFKDDYVNIAPPNSFIHYEDFETPIKLVEYLRYLDRNDTAYSEYFQWRKLFPCNYPLYRHNDTEEYNYAVNSRFSSFHNAYCNLCKLLRDGLHLNSSKTVESLNEYWYKDERPECLAT